MLQEVWEKDFPLRYYEVGRDGKVSLLHLMNFFQDAADEHARHLEVGVPQMVSRGLGWFVTRFHFRLDRYPVYGETVRIRTWPKAKKRVFAVRDFEMFSGDERIAAGTTLWCLVDLDSRKPLNVATTLPGLPERPRDALSATAGKIRLPEEMPFSRDLIARESEIDMHGHVNNAVSVGWALETLPGGSLLQRTVSEMVVSFQKEIRSDQNVRSLASFREEGSSAESFHVLRDEAGDREFLRMRLVWE